ncbi:hypothetical protein D9615_004722 [Tricholomella constricta]|uniref:Uncharacterized protein n=1 Tax=Tricholomella constricta TaxID=117010 RepID=A0A8H5HBY4_9AGAR|nr:hypothetical protein D9615_004722 [Tricholomella constricta]
MATYRSEPPVPTDIITYRCGSKLVYVRPADSYEQALDFAQKEFPEELAELPRDRIFFNISAKMNGEHKQVRISESAWVAAVTRLLRGEVIDVCVRPEPRDTKSELPPPQYLEVPQRSLRQSSSAPSSPQNRSREPSPTPSDKGSRSWFGRH